MDEQSSMVEILLPWPPSVNHYWRHGKNGHYISSEGRAYREQVNYLCSLVRGKFEPLDRLQVTIEAYPPDRRKRDLDNLLKSLLDSLQHAGVYADDSQIDHLSITRKLPLKGKVAVLITKEFHRLEMHHSLVLEPLQEEALLLGQVSVHDR